jgi:hypothetical protein
MFVHPCCSTMPIPSQVHEILEYRCSNVYHRSTLAAQVAAIILISAHIPRDGSHMPHVDCLQNVIDSSSNEKLWLREIFGYRERCAPLGHQGRPHVGSLGLYDVWLRSHLDGGCLTFQGLEAADTVGGSYTSVGKRGNTGVSLVQPQAWLSR